MARDRTRPIEISYSTSRDEISYSFDGTSCFVASSALCLHSLHYHCHGHGRFGYPRRCRPPLHWIELTGPPDENSTSFSNHYVISLHTYSAELDFVQVSNLLRRKCVDFERGRDVASDLKGHFVVVVTDEPPRCIHLLDCFDH